MKKYIIGLLLVSSILIPGFSFAQVEDIDPNPIVSDCVNIVNNLRYRDRDINTNGEVSTLQDFLQSQNYLRNDPTGYFGILTVKAVKNFQKENNINPTGYVGAITRGVIKNLSCNGTIVNSKKPIISGISGPQSLNINETGTWKVKAYDPNGGDLSYSVDWGDISIVGIPQLKNSEKYEKKQSATFTHSYSQSGTYTPKFTVTNINGQSASASLSVNVGQTIEIPKLKVISPNGGEALSKGKAIKITWKDNQIGCLTEEECTRILPAPKYYDINLVRYSSPCTSDVCPMMPSYAPYTIAKKVYGFSYKWNVGDVIGNGGTSEMIAPDGSYTMQVCRTGTDVCDSSDSYFKITTSEIFTPSITVISPNGGEIYKMGETFYPQWKVSGMSISDYVTIELQDTVNNSQIILGKAQAIDGSVKLAFPASSSWALGNRYKIRITAENFLGNTIAQDYSDNLFTIQ